MESGSDDRLKRIYYDCEKGLNSPTTGVEDKAIAWRRQALILAHSTRNSTETFRASAIRKHFEKDKNYEEYIDKRAKAVKELLKGQGILTNKVEDFDFDKYFRELESSQFESNECRGNYESCRADEVSEKNLNKLHTFFSTSNCSKLPESKPAVQERKRPQTLNHFFKKQSPEVLNSSDPSQLLAKSNFSSRSADICNPQTSSSDYSGFRTAREELVFQNMKKYENKSNSSSSSNSAKTLFNYGATKKSLGARRTVRSDFVPPIRKEENNIRLSSRDSSPSCTPPDTEMIDERLANIDPKMIELITNEIMHKYKSIDWTDIAGLEYAKSIIKEAVVWPLLRPDIFTGLRRPPRGILLFGPPGTGKTLIGKCIASQSKSTFFSISASSLTSKWVGDGEKMVRALFAVAAVYQPSVVFIDEIDSLLSQRSENEHESSRRLKTEFLVQLDGATTSDEDRILIVGATNRPQELDEAARRRLVRRLYIPLPDIEARIQILTNLLKSVYHNIDKEQINEISNLANGYSGADMEMLCREASMEPIRSIPAHEIEYFDKENVRPITINDFHSALQRVRASVSQQDLQQYIDWNRIYGAGH